MNKLIILAVIIISLQGYVNANDFRIELKAGYFSPSEQAFQDIYGGGLMYGGEISIEAWKRLDVWVGVNYFSKKGELSFSKEETTLELIPLDAGIKYRILDGNFAIYLGLGIRYYQYKEKNPIGEVSKGEIGYLGKIGGYIKITEGVFIDLYMNYSYCNIKPADLEINVGGIEAGMGLGYKF